MEQYSGTQAQIMALRLFWSMAKRCHRHIVAQDRYLEAGGSATIPTVLETTRYAMVIVTREAALVGTATDVASL